MDGAYTYRGVYVKDRCGIRIAREAHLLIVRHALGSTPLVEPLESRLASLRHRAGVRKSVLCKLLFPPNEAHAAVFVVAIWLS